MAEKKKNSALNLKEGVQPLSHVNEKAVEKFRKGGRGDLNPSQLSKEIIAGNRTALSRAITLIESSLPEHQVISREVITRCLPHSGSSFRIGITGVPGAGKSTLIETFGNFILEDKSSLAVLAIDPSSERSGGSILGDKTRMESLAGKERAYIRPSPSGGTLGGVARKTRESIILCEAAGYDTVIVETVGVGQSETTVHSMVDFFLVVMIPGAGDELQGMKRGIMELADALIINKADGDNIERANRSKNEYSNALHLFPLPPSGWQPRVLTCSSLEATGIPEIWNMLNEYKAFTNTNGYFRKRRNSQGKYWMYQALDEGLKSDFYDNPEVKNEIERMEMRVEKGEVSSFVAAMELLRKYFKNQI